MNMINNYNYGMSGMSGMYAVNDAMINAVYNIQQEKDLKLVEEVESKLPSLEQEMESCKKGQVSITRVKEIQIELRGMKKKLVEEKLFVEEAKVTSLIQRLNSLGASTLEFLQDLNPKQDFSDVKAAFSAPEVVDDDNIYE